MTLPAGSPRARRGSANGRAKLSDAQRAELRRLYDEGDWTYPALAARFGISRSAVWHVLVAPDEPEASAPEPAAPPPAWPPPDRPGAEAERAGNLAGPIDWTPSADRPCPRLGRIPDARPIRRRLRPGIKPRGQRTPPRIVQRIRHLHAEGVPGKVLARLSGLAEGTISEMVNRKTHRGGKPRLPALPGPKAGVTYRLIPGYGSLYALGTDESLWTSARGRWRRKAWTRPRTVECHFRYAGLYRDGSHTSRTIQSLMREAFPERTPQARRATFTAWRLARPLPETRNGIEFRAIPAFPGYALGSDRSVLFSGPRGWQPKKLNRAGRGRKTPYVVLSRDGSYFSRSLESLMREVFPELADPHAGQPAEGPPAPGPIPPTLFPGNGRGPAAAAVGWCTVHHAAATPGGRCGRCSPARPLLLSPLLPRSGPRRSRASASAPRSQADGTPLELLGGRRPAQRGRPRHGGRGKEPRMGTTPHRATHGP